MPRSKVQIVLASGSKWRRRLLKRFGIHCRVYRSRFREKHHHKDPKLIVIHNACGKAKAAKKFFKRDIIIGVDTIGVFRGKILRKPKDRTYAKRMLKMILGSTHQVISGLCVLNAANGKRITATEITKVTFRKITDDELEKYLDSNEWKGKAGSYAIQGRAKKFVRKIVGDRTNVVGLPIEKLKKIISKVF